MRTWITAAALGAAALGGLAGAGAQAQASSRPAQPLAADNDGERLVSRDEAAAAADRRFAAMDANHDGKLTRDERRAWREQRRAPQRGGPPPGEVRDGGAERHQRKPDAELSQADFRARELHRFDRIDTNHDGRIDQRERDAMMLMMRARRAGGDARPPRGGDMPPPPTDDGGTGQPR